MNGILNVLGRFVDLAGEWILAVFKMLFSDNLIEVLNDIHQTMMSAIGPAAILAATVLLFNVLLPKRLPTYIKLWLWTLVLARLMMPAGPQSQYSLAAAGTWFTQNVEVRTPSQAIVPENLWESVSVDDSGTTVTIHSGDGKEPQYTVDDVVFAAFSVSCVVGLLVIPLWTVFAHGRFVNRILRIAPAQDARLNDLLSECRRTAKLRTHVPIILTDTVSQPAVMGQLQPRLLLPTSAQQLTDDQLRMVMLHELAHVKRWDIAANWVLLFIRTFCWWNPVYWLAAARYRSLREQACDAFVIRSLPPNQRRSYGELLISLTDAGESPLRSRMILPASILGFRPSLFRARSLRNRIQALPQAAAPGTRWQQGLALVLLSVVAWCGFTSAAELMNNRPAEVAGPGSVMEIPTAPNVDLLQMAEFGVPPAFDRAILVRNYDVTKAIDGIAVRKRNREQAEQTLWVHALGDIQSAEKAVLQAASAEGLAANELPDEALPSFTLKDDRLTLRVPQWWHERFVEMQEAMEISGIAQVLVETKLMSAPSKFTAEMIRDWDTREGITLDLVKGPVTIAHGEAELTEPPRVRLPPPQVKLMSQDEENLLFSEFQAEGHSSNWYLPKVTIFNGRSGAVQSQSLRPFVLDGRIDEGGVSHPRIDILPDGLEFTFRPVLSKDRKSIHLKGQLTLNSITDVVAKEVTLDKVPMTLQVPQILRYIVGIDETLPVGSSLCLELPEKLPGKRRVISLTPGVIEE